MLTRDELVKPQTKQITVSLGDLLIRALTANEALEIEGLDMKSKEIFQVVAKSIVEPVLSPEDIGLFPMSVTTEIVTEIFLFNGLGKKAVSDAVNELKKTMKNEQPTQ